MKAKKKRLGTKAKIRAEKEKERKIATTIFLALMLLLLVFSAYFGYTFLNQPQSQTISPEPSELKTKSSELKAAIVDQLSLAFPNHTFVEAATNILKQAGYSIDYFSWESVTVQFYRNLAVHNYKLIILRVHSTSHMSSEKGDIITPAVFFTSEPYTTTKYVNEQLADEVFQVAYDTPNSKTFFAIGPKFVQYKMKGTFKNSTIIMMGCESLLNAYMAEAFIRKGAKAYIGWNGGVSIQHTDQATIRLLQHLILDKQTIKQSITNTMKEIGPDPTYNSILQYYPPSSAQQTIESIIH